VPAHQPPADLIGQLTLTFPSWSAHRVGSQPDISLVDKLHCERYRVKRASRTDECHRIQARNGRSLSVRGRPTVFVREVRIEDAWSTLTFWASALRGHRYFDTLGISILLTLIESPFSSPVRLTV
jgi:hypothetical protein